jgi:DnaJ-class molecular chaperone
MRKGRPLEPIEVKCDACNGTGSQSAQKPEPGRRIYPGRCKKCGGKGRIPKSE